MIRRIILGLLLAVLLVSAPAQPIIMAPFEPWKLPETLLFMMTDYGVTTDVDGVSDWINLGSWPDASQTTGTLEPDVVSSHFASGKDGIQGDGTDDLFDLGSEQNTTGDWTTAFVIDQELAEEGKSIFGQNGGDLFPLNASFDDWAIKTNGAPFKFATDAKTHDDNPHYYVICSDSSGNKTATQDGSDVSPSADADTDNWTTQFLLSANDGGTAGSAYIVGVLAIWDTDLCADGYVTQLEDWLANWSGI